MASKPEPEDPLNNNESGVVPTTLFDLPDKCLINIFKWIPYQNLDDIIELSPRFDKLIQEHLPVEMHLTDIGFRIALHYFIGFDSLPKYRVKLAHSRVLDEPLPNLKSPEDLHYLEFATHTELATYKSLTAGAVNLQELHFGYSSLCDVPLSDADAPLGNLKVLEINDRTIEYRHSDRHQILTKNIIGFMQKSLPAIQTFSLSTSTSRQHTIEYAVELLRFIQRHCDTLKKVKLNMTTYLLKAGSFGISDLFELPSEEFDLAKMSSVKLEELDLHFGANFFVGMEQWMGILSNQAGLSHLKLGTDKFLPPAVFVSPITQSASSLVSVELGVEIFDKVASQPVPFDCAVFENCPNLRMIALVGPAPTEEGSRSPAQELLNLGKLPNTVVALAIENIFVETGSFLDITRGMLQKRRKMENVSLTNVGVEGDYGVTLALLDTWISAQALTEIIVKGLNGNDMKLHEYDHLLRIGVKSPVAKCSVHALYNPRQMEYCPPSEAANDQVEDFGMSFPGVF